MSCNMFKIHFVAAVPSKIDFINIKVEFLSLLWTLILGGKKKHWLPF